MSGFIGSGQIYGERTVDGVSEGLVPLGNAVKLEIKENSETKTRISKSNEDYGSALDTVVIKRPADVMLTLDDLQRDNLALIFMGDLTQGGHSAGTVTGESHVVGNVGSLIALNQGEISAVAIAGLTEGTDFAIEDASAGFIKILAGGSVTKGDTLSIDYTSAAVTSDKVSGGLAPNVTMRLIMIGENLVDESAVRVNIPKAVMTPQTGVDFLSEDFTQLELQGIANVAVKGNAAYTVETNVKAT